MTKVPNAFYTLLPGRKKKPDELDILIKAKEENKKASDGLAKLLNEMMENLNHG